MTPRGFLSKWDTIWEGSHTSVRQSSQEAESSSERVTTAIEIKEFFMETSVGEVIIIPNPKGGIGRNYEIMETEVFEECPQDRSRMRLSLGGIQPPTEVQFRAEWEQRRYKFSLFCFLMSFLCLPWTKPRILGNRLCKIEPFQVYGWRRQIINLRREVANKIEPAHSLVSAKHEKKKKKRESWKLIPGRKKKKTQQQQMNFSVERKLNSNIKKKNKNKPTDQLLVV